MRIYLAGPMTGYREHNFPAFIRAARTLHNLGHDVVSPHELQEETFRLNAPFTRAAWHRAMRRDIEALLTVEALVALPGHERSEGCRVEVAVAQALGLQVWTLQGFLSK